MAVDVALAPDEHNRLWEAYDLAVVRERFRVKSPYGHLANLLEQETRKYLFLCSVSPEPLSPSDLVDEFWHALILNTRVYKDYCQKALGKFIDHGVGIPSDNKTALQDYKKSYQQTLNLYRQYFGEPNKHIWPRRVRNLPERYKKPYRIHIETTNHCNLNCQHCYPASSIHESHHDAETIYKVLDEAKRNNIGKITLTGGEVLTRPDWKDIFKRALDVCNNIYFISNGLLLDEKKLRWLARQRTIRTFKKFLKGNFKDGAVEIGVAISLDGLEGNKLVRQNAAGKPIDAEQILEKIALATRYGLHVTVNTTITNSVTAKELPRMYDILSKLNIDRWQLDQAYIAGRLKTGDLKDEGLFWLEEAKPGYKYIIANYLKNYPDVPDWRLEIVQVFRYDMLFSGFTPAASLDEHPCSYHFGSVIVEKGDEIRFCPSLRNAGIGKLSQYGSFQNVYESNAPFKDFLNYTIRDLPCKNCRYGKLFHGGCRANSYSYAGKMWDRDPICCSLSPFVEDQIVPLLPPTLQHQFKSSLTGGHRPDQPDHPNFEQKQTPNT